MKFGVIASKQRDGTVCEDTGYVSTTLTSLIKGLCPNQGKNAVIISGGGKGPETIAIDYANQNGFEVERVIPHIATLGHEKAFIARNRKIVETCDVLVVYWTGDNHHVLAALNDAAFMRRPVVLFSLP